MGTKQRPVEALNAGAPRMLVGPRSPTVEVARPAEGNFGMILELLRLLARGEERRFPEGRYRAA